jgi:hypothetical protein
MSDQPPPPIPKKLKTLRVIRYFVFAFLYAGVEIALMQIPLLRDLAVAAHQSDLVALAVALGMTFILMIAILIGGMQFTDLTAEWKPQLFGVFSFFWSIDTCRTIGYVLARYFSPGTENEGVLFTYFFVGLIILLPFEMIAFRAYRTRKGLPTWPNLPKQ